MQSVATWMDLEITTLSKSERQMPYDMWYLDSTYMWNLKYDTNEPVYKTETDTENKFMVNKEERA